MSERGCESHRHFLPVVSHETLESAAASEREEDYFEKGSERFEREQPDLNQFLGIYAAIYAGTPQEQLAMFRVAIIVYDVLSRQAEADAMRRDFIQDPPTE